MSQVGPVDVLLASLVAGLAAWAVYALLARTGHPRWWPFVASTALAISITGPSYLADGIAAVALICLHVAVGVVLIAGFVRFMPPARSRRRPGRRPLAVMDGTGGR